MIFYFQFSAQFESGSKCIVLDEWRRQFDFEYVMRRKNKKNKVQTIRKNRKNKAEIEHGLKATIPQPDRRDKRVPLPSQWQFSDCLAAALKTNDFLYVCSMNRASKHQSPFETIQNRISLMTVHLLGGELRVHINWGKLKRLLEPTTLLI